MRHNLTNPLLSGDLVKIAGQAMKWTNIAARASAVCAGL